MSSPGLGKSKRNQQGVEMKPKIATANGLSRGQESAALIKITEDMGMENIQEAVEYFIARDSAHVTVSIDNVVDLDKSPRPIRSGDIFVRHISGGIVKIELRTDDNLYLDGKKVELCRLKVQRRNRKVGSRKLLKDFETQNLIPLNSNVLDHLFKNLELIPEYWKKGENGDDCILFCGSIFKIRDRGDDTSYARCLFKNGNGFLSIHSYLDSKTFYQSLFACIAS